MDKAKHVKNRDKYLEIARNYAQLLRENGYDIRELYVFGSRLSGNNSKWSDLDVCVVSPNLKRDRFAEAVRFTLMGRQISDIIEPHLMSPLEFCDSYNLLAREVRRKGIKVV